MTASAQIAPVKISDDPDAVRVSRIGQDGKIQVRVGSEVREYLIAVKDVAGELRLVVEQNA